MAQLQIRKTNGGQAQQNLQLRNEPLRLLREMTKWDPFSELAPVFGLEPTEGIYASFDVKETANAWVFKADVPGFAEKDIDISTAGNRLTISGKRADEREDKGDTYYVCERRYGAFSRAFTLPRGADADHVHAELKQGVLTVTVPRMPEPPATKIVVKSASAKA